MKADHPLFMLRDQIKWEALENDLGLVFSPDKKGQGAKPVRLIVGILMLQHMEGISDEAVVKKWVENPNWEYFCGYETLQWKFPIHGTSLTRWRKGLGEEGLEKILSHTLQTAVIGGVAKEKDFKRVIADTTVMEENIEYATDSTLLNKAREHLVALAKKEGIELRQSYEFVGKALLNQVKRYAHAKQFKRMQKGIKKLKGLLGRVVRDGERKVTQLQGEAFKDLLEMAKRLLAQEQKSSDKLYSLPAPHAYCISKGKARRPYEFGSKVSLLVIHKQGLVLSSQALEKPSYDGHTLKDSLIKAGQIRGVKAEEAFVDKGYKGHEVLKEDCAVYISGQRRGLTKALKKPLKRRSAIEPHIGHMKSEGKLGRNFLKGPLGMKLNALSCGIGHNLRLILNHL